MVVEELNRPPKVKCYWRPPDGAPERPGLNQVPGTLFFPGKIPSCPGSGAPLSLLVSLSLGTWSSLEDNPGPLSDFSLDTHLLGPDNLSDLVAV